MTSVSVIVNVYNGVRYVGECLESIANLQCDVDLQVIAVDDASRDASLDVIQSFRERLPMEVVAIGVNVGAAAAVNLAFERVRGEFVGRIDYDDRYRPTFVADSLPALCENPEAAFVCGSAQMIGPAGEAWGLTGPFDYGEPPGCSDRFASMLARNFVTAPTLLARTAHWRRSLPVPRGMNFCDWYMNLTMAERAPVAVVGEVTADYRVHPGGMHVTNVRDGSGERITFDVVDRFLNGERQAELAPLRASIRAGHLAAWGDRYFGAGMERDALRCYLAAFRADAPTAWRARCIQRCAGALLGRPTYEGLKRLVRPSAWRAAAGSLP